MNEAPVVIAQGLTKLFKDFWLRDRARAVDGIDFEVRRGEVFGLLGPNGSGKSTTIKMILGLLRKTSGRLAVFQMPPHDVSIKKRIGYLPEESYLYPFLNARETLDYYAKLFQLEGSVRKRRIDELLDMVGLTGVQHRQVREYSKGMQRRIGIAQALINDPELLILDEPTTGLDPIGTRQVKDLISMLGKRGKTIILSSHLLGDVEDCVDRLVILYGGKIRAAGTCDSLLESQERVVLETETLDPQTLEEVNAVLARHRRSAASISRPRQKLEDLFIDLVEKAQADRVATSGARHGGVTASFLAEGATGGDLISNLVTSKDEAQAAMPVAPRPAAAPTNQPDRSLIEGLSGAAPVAPVAPAKPASVPNKPAQEPDRDLLGSLLGDDQSKPKGPENQGR